MVSRKQIAGGITLLMTLATPLLFFITGSAPAWAVWAIALVVFALAHLLAAAERLWLAYLSLPVLVTWLTGGLPAALLLVVLGVALAVLLRQQPVVPLRPFRHPFETFTGRAAMNGTALLVTAGVYTLLGGELPLDPDNLAVVPLVIALLVMLFAMRASAYSFAALEAIPNTPDDAIGRGSRFLNELLLVAAPVPLTLVYDGVGLVTFALLMALVAVQVIRHYQITTTQAALVQRVHELSLLNHVGKNITTTLEMDDVLHSVYERVNELAHTVLFCVALYDADDDIITFPLVMREGQPETRARHALTDDPFMTQVVRSRAVLLVDRATDAEYGCVFDNLPDDYRAQIALGIPLVTGQSVTGVMALVIGRDQHIFSGLELKVLETIANQASLAVHNARLYASSTELAGHLTQINQSVQDVMFNMDSADAIRAACKTARQIAGAQKVAFFLSDHETGQVRLVESIDLSAEHIALYNGPIHCPDIYYSDPRLVHDVAGLEERDALRELAAVGGFQALAEIPLRSGNAVVGLLTVFHDAPHHYGRTELELLETLAYQVTAAIDYTELLGALELYASEQAQLVYLSRSTTSSLDLSAVLNSVIVMLQQMMNVDHVRIGLFAPGQEQMTLYEHETPPSLLPVNAWPELERLENGLRVYSTAKASPELVAHMQAHDEYMLVVIPMQVQETPLGVVLLGNHETHHFSDSERRLIEMATNQIAAQIHNAQTYRSTEDALDRRLQQLSLIVGIARQISSSLELDQIINNVLDAAINATEANTASIALVNDQGGLRIITRELAEGDWFQYEHHKDTLIGLVGQTITGNRTIITPDTAQSDAYVPSDAYKQTYHSSVTVPLAAQDGVIGALNVESAELDFFNDERIEFVENLAGHTVISIQNAQLLEERQTRINTLDALRHLSVRLSNDTDVHSVINATMETTLNILRGEAAAVYHSAADGLTLVDGMRRVGGRYLNDRVLIPPVIPRRVAESGTIEVISDVTQSPDYDAFEQRENVAYTGLIAAPIKHGATVHEVLCVTLAQQRPFTAADRNTLELLTTQVAGHLENARLYERIQAERSRMRAILDTTRDGIILLDRQGNLAEANISAENLLNISLEDHINQDFTRLLQTRENGHAADLRDALMKAVETLRSEPQRITSRSVELQHGNKVRYLEEVESPVFDEDNQITGRLLTLRDVTEEKLLDAYRDEISSMVVHDLRGPLGSIISSLTLTREIMNEMADEATNATLDPLMGVSLDSADNLLRLVDSILDIAKLETRRMTIDRAPTAVDELVAGAVTTLGSLAQSAQVTFSEKIAEKLPPVDVDADKIRRVLVNLLHNAISYTPSGGEVLISATPAGSRKVVIRVADSGPGIPPEEAERVFEKFRQIKSNVPQHGHKGSGLGLTFCKLALEAHGETIWVEPDGPLSGACFAFTLPAVTATEASEVTQETKQN